MKLFLFISSVLLLSACYSYDGPTHKANYGLDQPSNPKAYVPGTEKVTSQNYLEKMAVAIKRTLPAAEVKILEDSIKVLFPDNIAYGKNRVTPLENIYEPIGKLSKLIIKFDQTDVLVTGHTDSQGDPIMNKRMSELRAQYIHDLIVSYKVDKSRLAYWGLGGNSPIAANDTEKGRAKNRRVEFVILSTIDD